MADPALEQQIAEATKKYDEALALKRELEAKLADAKALKRSTAQAAGVKKTELRNEFQQKLNQENDPIVRARLREEYATRLSELESDTSPLVQDFRRFDAEISSLTNQIAQAESDLKSATNEKNQLTSQQDRGDQGLEPALESAPLVPSAEAPNTKVEVDGEFIPVNEPDQQVKTSGFDTQINPDEDTAAAGADSDQNGQDQQVSERKIISNEDSAAILADIARDDEDALVDAPATREALGLGPKGLTSPLNAARSSATEQDQTNFQFNRDWRVRLRLANGTEPRDQYLYKSNDPGILLPLKATDGIIFPYTPKISISYAAHYDSQDIVHANYRTYMYKNSSVDNISISCDFTAQDTYEANYLLATIHFLRTITKMFYGQDQNPNAGTPPPLCFLSGLGAFQFDNHPLAITGFTYILPDDVDYIRSSVNLTTPAGVNKSPANTPNNIPAVTRLDEAKIGLGGTAPPPKFQRGPGGTIEPTYVPTKMNIQITAIPMVSRNSISNNFSLKDYSTGKLLQSNKRQNAGFW